MPPTNLQHPDVQYETNDIRARLVLLTGALVLGGTILAVLLMWFYFDWMRDVENPPVAREGPAPVFQQLRVPRLQELPRYDYDAYRARQQAILQGKPEGVIPITEAMERIVERGIPAPGNYAQYNLHTPSAGHKETGFDPIWDRR